MPARTRPAADAASQRAAEGLLEAWGLAQDLQLRIPGEVEARFGIPPHRLPVLGAVQRGVTRVQDIAAASFTSVSAASRTVDGLVKEGWLDRRPDPADRRASRVTLTAQGEAEMAEISAWAQGMVAGIVADLGTARAARMADDLAVFATRISEELDRQAEGQ